jgi:hypothetical protein
MSAQDNCAQDDQKQNNSNNALNLFEQRESDEWKSAEVDSKCSESQQQEEQEMQLFEWYHCALNHLGQLSSLMR